MEMILYRCDVCGTILASEYGRDLCSLCFHKYIKHGDREPILDDMIKIGKVKEDE